VDEEIFCQAQGVPMNLTHKKATPRGTSELTEAFRPLESEMEEIDALVQVIEPVRKDLVNKMLLALVVFAPFPLAVLLVRASNEGYLSVYAPLIACYMVCVLTFLMRRQLSFHVRAGIVLGLLFIVGTNIMLTTGLVGMGSYYLFAVCIVAVILFGVRHGLIALVCSMAIMSIIGLKTHLGDGFLHFDFVTYATDPLAWIIRILSLGLFGSIVIVSVSQLYRTLSKSIEARDRAVSELKRSKEAIRNFSAHLQESIEDERKRIARELHDELGQSLTSLRMELAALKGRFQRDQGPLIEKSESMLELLNRTITSVKRICSELRPSIMDDLGLTAAIEWLAEDFQDRTDIQVKVHTDSPDIFTEDTLSIAVFRITQEALTNVVRHADAAHVQITLELEDSDLTLTVQDNGRGIQQKAMDKSGTFGILGIQERVSILGGDLTIQGDPETGTRIHVRLPLKKGNKHDTRFDRR
jgi:signal transduction histidine kinase